MDKKFDINLDYIKNHHGNNLSF